MVPQARCRHRPVYRGVLTVCQRPCDKTQGSDNGSPSPSSSSSSSSPCSPSSPRSCFRSASFTSHPQRQLQCRELFVFHKRTLQCQCVYIPCSTIRTTRHCTHRVLLLKQRSLTGLQSDPGPRPWSSPWGQFTTCPTLDLKRSLVLYENGVSKAWAKTYFHCPAAVCVHHLHHCM